MCQFNFDSKDKLRSNYAVFYRVEYTTSTYCGVQTRCYATTARWADIPGPLLRDSR
jgi:hypothetical protein